MGIIDAQKTVAQLVIERPDRTRIFERLGIDYCCGGRQTLAEACTKKGLDVHTVVETLRAVEEADGTEPDRGVGVEGNGERDWNGASLTELCNHIETTHHQYLYGELPRIGALMEKVVDVHGTRHPHLYEVQEVFSNLRDELLSHLAKEERILFPAIRQLEAAGGGMELPFGSVASPIRAMEMEHDSAGKALARMRELTGGYTPPADACNSFRALLSSLAELEQDLHLHIHKENNVLFPRAIAIEQATDSPSQ